MTAPVSSFGQNHNPEFKVSDSFLGGEPYIFIGDVDTDAYPLRTPVELKYRDGIEVPKEGTVTLQWVTTGGAEDGAVRVLANDSEDGTGGFTDGEDNTSVSGSWTWIDNDPDDGVDDLGDYENQTMYLQGVADTVDSNGNVTNSYAGDVVKLETSLSNNPEKFSKDFTLLKVDLAGHLPGPNGQRISEAYEDDPDKLVVVVNDNFDERRRDSGSLQADNTDDEIDLSKDQDYIRITLQFPDSIDQGTLSLKSSFGIGSTESAANSFVNIFSEDGSTELDGTDFELNLSSPQGPLADIATTGEVTLLVEGNDDVGREDVLLIWKYEVGSTSVSDELHFHLINVDFEDTADAGYLDDDDALDNRNVMSDPGVSGSTQIRKIDWRNVEE
jgi:hypothetical protein